MYIMFVATSSSIYALDSSGRGQGISPSAQVKAASTHAQRLENRQENIFKPVYMGRLTLSYGS